MSEAEMHYVEMQYAEAPLCEALLWIEALEWFMRGQGLTVPTWAEMVQMGWKSK